MCVPRDHLLGELSAELFHAGLPGRARHEGDPGIVPERAHPQGPGTPGERDEVGPGRSFVGERAEPLEPVRGERQEQRYADLARERGESPSDVAEEREALVVGDLHVREEGRQVVADEEGRGVATGLPSPAVHESDHLVGRERAGETDPAQRLGRIDPERPTELADAVRMEPVRSFEERDPAPGERASRVEEFEDRFDSMEGPVQTVASPGANRRASQGKSAGSDGRRGTARVRRGCRTSFGRVGGEEGNGCLGSGRKVSSTRRSSGANAGSVRRASTIIDRSGEIIRRAALKRRFRRR